MPTAVPPQQQGLQDWARSAQRVVFYGHGRSLWANSESRLRLEARPARPAGSPRLHHAPTQAASHEYLTRGDVMCRAPATTPARSPAGGGEGPRLSCSPTPLSTASGAGVPSLFSGRERRSRLICSRVGDARTVEGMVASWRAERERVCLYNRLCSASDVVRGNNCNGCMTTPRPSLYSTETMRLCILIYLEEAGGHNGILAL